MTIGTELKEDFDNFVETNGDFIRLKYYSQSTSGLVYDDEISLTGSYSVWSNAQYSNMISKTNGTDAKLLEQGKVEIDDSIFYIKSDVEIDSNTKIGLGSPVREEYVLLPDVGVRPYKIGETVVYKKVYAKILNTGSFIGEV
jgi:hypothetical protein